MPFKLCRLAEMIDAYKLRFKPFLDISYVLPRSARLELTSMLFGWIYYIRFLVIMQGKCFVNEL